MSLKQYTFGLDLVSDSIRPIILARVTENNAVTTIVQLTNNGAEIPDFGDYRPIFECRLPGGYFVRDDGSTYDNMEILDPIKGIIKYTMAKEVFARHGELNLCYFVLEKGGSVGFQVLEELDLSADVRVTTPNFTIQVGEDATQGNIEQKDFISDIAALNNFIRESTAEAMEVLNVAIAQLNESTDTANELIALINSNDVVLISETINWQKAKLTADSGVAKSPPNVTTLAAIIEQGSFYINSTVAAALTDAPSTGSFRLENHKLITGTAIEQHARYFSPTNAAANRHFFRYVGATVSPWREYENTVGSQAKADAAKTSANSYTDTAISSFAPFVQLFRGAAYFLDTNTYTFPADAVKLGLYIDISRYTPGTGPLDYGFRTIFIPREALLENSGKAVWEGMTGTDGAKKTFYGTPTSIRGHADNGASPNTGWCIRRIGYR